MLILVAVTTSMAVNGGLFEYARNAGTKTNAAVDSEQQLANLEVNMTVDEMIDKYTKDNNALELVNIGDYVKYPVEYTNVATWYSTNGTEKGNYPRDEFTGWRVLSKETDEEGNILYVKLISAGVPLSFYHYNYADDCVESFTTNFLKTEITNDAGIACTFYKCGFKNVTGTTLEGTFANDYTDRVQALTKVELDKAVMDLGGAETLSNSAVTDEKYKNLFAVPCKGNQSSEYAIVYLASKRDSNSLWRVNAVGMMGGTLSDSKNFGGIRVVVSLKSNVIFELLPKDEHLNGPETWKISV